MERSPNSVGNSSLISIRKAPLQNVLSDTNEHEEIKTPTLSLEALRTIGRLVRTFRAKIESESRIFK
jgi:hypothetical protein